MKQVFRIFSFGLLAIVMSAGTQAQLGLGFQLGYSRAFSEKIPPGAANNYLAGLQLQWRGESLFAPMLDIELSTMAVDQSWLAASPYFGEFYLKYGSVNLQASTLIAIKKYDQSQSGFVPGIGLSFLRQGRFYFHNADPNIPGALDMAAEDPNLLKAFVSLAYLGQRSLNKYWDVQAQIGARYYVDNNLAQTSATYTNANGTYTITTDHGFKAFRPFFKLAFVRKFSF